MHCSLLDVGGAECSQRGDDHITPRDDLSFSQNFLYMVNDRVPEKIYADTLDISLREVDGTWQLSYLRPAHIEDVIYTIDSSIDLHNWVTEDPLVKLTDETLASDGFSKVTVRTVSPLTANVRLFLRIGAQQR